MNNNRPHYGRYLLGWCGLWLLLTVPTQLPELYERSIVLAPWQHVSVFREWVEFAGLRLLIEIPFGLLWGSLSWLLQWGAGSMLNRVRIPSFFQRPAFKGLWANMAAVILLASVEAVMLGIPLASMNTACTNFSLGVEDTPPVTITDPSIMIESTGILLAFPLACLVAGYFGGRRRKPRTVDAVVDQADAWPPAPRRSA